MIRVVKIKLLRTMNRKDEAEPYIHIIVNQVAVEPFSRLLIEYLEQMIIAGAIIRKITNVADAETNIDEELWFELAGNHEMLVKELIAKIKPMVDQGMLIIPQNT